MVAVVALIACLPIVALILMCIQTHRTDQSRFHNSRLIHGSELAAAWFLGLMFLSGGMSKLMPFPGVMGPVWLEQELSVHGLGLYARFIAWAEAFIGLCLLAKPTRALGAIMLVPLLLNILMVTVSMSWRGTPWIIMIFLFTNAFLLAYHYPRWRTLINSGTEWLSLRFNDKHHLTTLAIWGGLGLILAGPIIHSIHFSVSTIAILLGLFGLIWGEFNLRFRYRKDRLENE